MKNKIIKEIEKNKEYFRDSDLDGVIDREDIDPENPCISNYEDLEKEKEEKDKLR